MSKLRVMSGRGDDETNWLAEDQASTDLAAAEFAKLMEQGYAAFSKTPDGHELIKEFDPAAEEIILIGARAGG